jgi:hypothetical protein
MTDEEIHYICDSIEETASNIRKWADDYRYIPEKNDYIHHSGKGHISNIIRNFFNIH